jgi:predicted lipoprotein with Yx(FWY)xxD motif
MNGLPRRIRRGGAKAAVGTLVGFAGFATAALVGVAIAKTFTLQVAKNASVTNQSATTKTENIVVTRSGRAVYVLTGDSTRHPKCTKANGCFSFWPPVTVSSTKKLSKAPGIRGKLGVWHRNGFLQVTLAGHPLYRYAGDSQKGSATGQGIHTFGGTWQVIKTATAVGGTTTQAGATSPMTTTTTSTMTTTTTSTTTTTTTSPMTTTTTSPTTTTTCVYPPYC